MNKPKAQGTAFESAFVRQAQAAGLLADRMPEGGMNDAGDVWIGDTPTRDSLGDDIAILAWKRLVKTGTQRRGSDGIASVVVMDVHDFWKLALLATANPVINDGVAFVVECKASERLNVTRELDKAKRKLALWKGRG